MRSFTFGERRMHCGGCVLNQLPLLAVRHDRQDGEPHRARRVRRLQRVVAQWLGGLTIHPAALPVARR